MNGGGDTVHDLFSLTEVFEKNSENAFSLEDESNGTNRKCSSRTFQRMTMSVYSDNLKLFGQFLCPELGDRSHQFK
jgi:hypothetical protein